MSQTLNSAVVSASCNVIVLWYSHQQAQLSCPLPHCSLSQESKLALFCTIKLFFRADNCISKRHCVWLEEARLSERLQRGRFGTTTPEIGKWLYYLAVSPQRYKLPTQQKVEKRSKSNHTFSPNCGFPFCFSFETRQKTQFKFALMQTSDTRLWSPAHCYEVLRTGHLTQSIGNAHLRAGLGFPLRCFLQYSSKAPVRRTPAHWSGGWPCAHGWESREWQINY